MRENSKYRGVTRMTAQAGTAAVEFALIVIVFFMFMFGVMEMARAMYLFNTLQEVTRRAAFAAANSDFSATTGLKIRRAAIFRGPDDARPLVLGAPVTAAHIRIDYMAVVRTSPDPQVINTDNLTPVESRKTCIGNPNDPKCVQLVQVRICVPDTDCVPVPYESIFPFVNLPVTLPIARTIVAAETLGQ